MNSRLSFFFPIPAHRSAFFAPPLSPYFLYKAGPSTHHRLKENFVTLAGACQKISSPETKWITSSRPLPRVIRSFTGSIMGLQVTVHTSPLNIELSRATLFSLKDRSTQPSIFPPPLLK